MTSTSVPGSWQGVTATADRLYVIDDTADAYIRAWGLDGARQAGDDINLGTGSWAGVTVVG